MVVQSLVPFPLLIKYHKTVSSYLTASAYFLLLETERKNPLQSDIILKQYFLPMCPSIMHAKISEESNRVYLEELHKIIDEISKKKKSTKIFGGSLNIPTFATQTLGFTFRVHCL